MITYNDTVEVHGYDSLDQLNDLVEELRGWGHAELDFENRTLRFGAEATNMWTLREYLGEQAGRLREHGYDYSPDIAKVERPVVAKREQELLEHMVYALESIGQLEGPFPSVSSNEIPTVDVDGLHIIFANGESFNVVARAV